MVIEKMFKSKIMYRYVSSCALSIKYLMNIYGKKKLDYISFVIV